MGRLTSRASPAPIERIDVELTLQRLTMADLAERQQGLEDVVRLPGMEGGGTVASVCAALVRSQAERLRDIHKPMVRLCRDAVPLSKDTPLSELHAVSARGLALGYEVQPNMQERYLYSTRVLGVHSLR